MRRHVDWNLLDGISLCLSYIPCLFHLRNDKIPPLKRLFGVDDRIVTGRFVHHSHQGCAFLDGELGRVLGEEGSGCGFDAISVAAEEDGIHIHIHNLVLGVVALEFHRGNPFLELDPYHFYLRPSGNFAAYVLARIEGLGQLLGDGASPSLTGVPAYESLDQHSSKALEINA